MDISLGYPPFHPLLHDHFFPSDGHNWDDTAGQTKKIDLRDTESVSGVVSQWAKRSSEIEKVQLTRTGAVNDWQKEL